MSRHYTELDNEKFYELHQVKIYYFGDVMKAYDAGGPCRSRGRKWINLQRKQISRMTYKFPIPKYNISSLFRDVMQGTFVVSFRSFGTTYFSHLQGSSSPNLLGLLVL